MPRRRMTYHGPWITTPEQERERIQRKREEYRKEHSEPPHRAIIRTVHINAPSPEKAKSKARAELAARGFDPSRDRVGKAERAGRGRYAVYIIRD